MTIRTKWAALALLTVGMAAFMAGCTGGNKTTEPEGTTGTAPATTGGSASTSARPLPTAEGNKQSGETIKIGLVASQNGELKPWGDDSVKGAQLAVKEINDAGGIQGKQVELLIADSASKPEQGKSAAEKLIADGALGLLGEVASGITLQMANSAFDKGVPVLAIGATRTDVTEKGNVFRVCYTDDFQGPVMAKFAYEELGLRNVGLVTDKAQPYSTGLSDSFRKKFEELGGKIVGEEFYESKQTQFQGQLSNLKSLNPDGLFLSGYFTEVGAIARQAKDAGLNVKFLGGDGWDSTELQTTGGDAIIGGYFCNHYNNEEQRPEVVNFLGKWAAASGGAKPGTTMGALGYDAAMLMMDALKRAKSLDSKALITALDETVDFPGVSGKITLAGMGGSPKKRALVVEVTATGLKFAKAYEPTDLEKKAP